MSILKHKLISVIILAMIISTVILVVQQSNNAIGVTTVFDSTNDAIHKQIKLESDQLNEQLVKSEMRNKNVSNSKLEKRIDHLNQEITELTNRLDGLRTDAMLSTMEKDDSLEEPQTEEDMADQLKAQAERQINSFEELATQEGIDEKWATMAEENVIESFQALAENGIGLSKVQCHSSFCQAQINVDSTEPEIAIGKLQGSSPWGGEVLIWIEDIEQGEGLVYLARDGHNLNLPGDREEM